MKRARVRTAMAVALCVFRMAWHFLAQDSPRDYLAGKGIAQADIVGQIEYSMEGRHP